MNMLSVNICSDEYVRFPLVYLWYHSEGDGSSDDVVAYYESEFEVPGPQQTSLDQAIASLEPPEESQQGRQGRLLLIPKNTLSVNSVMSGGLTTAVAKTLYA